ncbi:MAG TPA: hypothetical protein DCZ59_06655, partial [Bacteroidetes bacterium]|nr:hypothetical protein [Bacteroidota bacterium]
MKTIINLFAFVLSTCAALAIDVRFGVDNLIESDFALLKGKRVVLVSHAAAQTFRGTSTAEEFASTPHLTLLRILTPEHGFYGIIEAGKNVEDDSLFERPVRSLYGSTRRP